MRTATDARGTLTITSAERWLPVVAVLLLVGAVGVWLGFGPPEHTLAWSIGFFVAALVCVAGFERSAFVFDRERRELVWRRWTPVHRAEGRVPFGEITSVSLEQAFDTQGVRSNARRIVVHTTHGVIPVTTGYSAGLAGHLAVANRIADALEAASPGQPRVPVIQ